MGPNSDIRPNGRHDLRRRTQVWAVPGRLEENDIAARNPAAHEFSDLLGRNNVFAALKDQGRYLDLGKVAPVVGCEGDTREGLGDLRVGAAEAVGQFLAEFRTVRIAHDGWRHGSGPTHVIVF